MIDRHSDTWAEIAKWIDERRENCVLSLVNGSAHDDKLRGQIRALDDLVDFAHEDKPPSNEPG